MQGTRLGPYEIHARLGAGGMGEVWLAQDTRLGRKVAIKVLPTEFAADAERLARFEQEARAAAALSHPNIAAVFDVGADGATHFIVQELLQGSTLRDELDAGPIEPARAVAIGIEIADALRAAHAVGIVHRDLKPENVFVTRDGHVKILDFGLAKLVETKEGASAGMTQSPTSFGTSAGMVMGTAGYMAPEQARGAAVDHRADLFAFGCLLYEALTGARAFPGESVIQVLNRVLYEEPQSLAVVAPTLSAELQRVVTKCLRKNVQERYQGAADLVVDLRTLAATPAAMVSERPSAGSHVVAERPTSRQRLGIMVMVAAALLAGYFGARLLSGGQAARDPVRLALPIGSLRMVPRLDGLAAHRPNLAMAPDGRTVVFEGLDDGGGRQLYRVDLLGRAAEPIPGTDGGFTPFFSPDGRWVGFHSIPEAALMKVALAGGAPVRVLPIGGTLTGGSWGRDDIIVFGTNASGLRRVSASGAEAEPLTVLGSGDNEHGEPHHLRDGEHLLFQVVRGEEVRIEVVSLVDGTRTALGVDGAGPQFVSTTAGDYLTYRQGTSLLAAPFDVRRRRVSGVPVDLLTATGSTYGTGSYAAAGTLAYVPEASLRQTRLVWVSRDGDVSPASVGATGPTDYVRLDAAGERVVHTASGMVQAEAWIYDRASDTSWPLLGDGGLVYPNLSPDGMWVAYSADNIRLMLRAADGSDVPRTLVDDGRVSVPMSWSPDGSKIYYYVVTQDTLRDIWSYTIESKAAAPLLATAADERTPMVSPDGRWLAYISNAPGSFEIFLTDVEATRPPRQVSRTGGSEPAWSAGSDELYFRSDDGWFMAVAVDRETGQPGPPTRLFADRFAREDFRNTDYAVAPDGRFLIPEVVDEAGAGAGPAAIEVFLGFADWVHQQVSSHQ